MDTSLFFGLLLLYSPVIIILLIIISAEKSKSNLFIFYSSTKAHKVGNLVYEEYEHENSSLTIKDITKIEKEIGETLSTDNQKVDDVTIHNIVILP